MEDRPRPSAAQPLSTFDVNTARLAPIRYRPDIDGLRALSVIAVIGFHAGIPGFGGGYVGVDVFFVISGYLITLLLIAPSSLTPGQRLREFYLRRARRILPALLVVLAVSAAIATILYVPNDLRKLGRSLALASGMLGNLGAWLNGGYYALPSPFVPLQHLWSIGVEEQFYLVYPLVILLLGLFLQNHRRTAIGLMAALSLAACIWASYRSPSANFYFSPTRAWQLLFGGLVALSGDRWSTSSQANDVVALSSLGALLAVVCAYDSSTQYPGLFAVLPTVGTAALLATSAHASLAGRLLCFRPLVFTGLISYSLYLWHAPVLAFAEYFNIERLGAVVTSVLLLAIYVLAVASWAFVERPVRTRRVLASDRAFVATAVISTVAIALAGIAFWRSDGLPQRFGPDVRMLTDAIDSFYVPEPACRFLPSFEEIRAGELCSFGPAKATHSAVIWGDSHAFALLPAYETLAASHGIRMHFASAGACRPLLGVRSRYDNDARHERCVAFNEAMVEAVARIKPDLIILNAYWGYPDTDLVVDDMVTSSVDPPPFVIGFERLLSRIGVPDRDACIVLTVPGYQHPIPYALAMTQRRGLGDRFIAMSRSAASEQYAVVEQAARALEARHLVRVVDPKDVLCSGETCALRSVDGVPLYRDANHLSIKGAQIAAPVLEGCFSDRSFTTLATAP
jgi:peptidoglycan/LPS O-acetylase OafA/YrhL